MISKLYIVIVNFQFQIIKYRNYVNQINISKRNKINVKLCIMQNIELHWISKKIYNFNRI